MLRAPVPLTDEVRAAADAAGVALLGLTRGASWAQLAAMLRSLLAEGDVGVAEPETLGGLPSGDLFALANAIAALLDAPITIEDRSSRVLAFSGRQDEADPSRVETILGRQVPERYARILEDRGVFRELYRSDRPVFVEPIPDADGFTMPRVALAVRAGDEILGSIWAAVHRAADRRARRGTPRGGQARGAAPAAAAGGRRRRAPAARRPGQHRPGGRRRRRARRSSGSASPTSRCWCSASRSTSAGRQGDDRGGGARCAHERQRLGDAFAMHLRGRPPPLGRRR